MKVVNRQYAFYINKKYKKTAALWQGTFRCCPVQAKNFLTCSRYIELSPVTANRVKFPEEYRWSSYHSNAWGDESWLAPHDEYKRLGETKARRCQSYRALFNSHLNDADIDLIQKAAYYCRAAGDDRFKHAAEKKYAISSDLT